MMSLKIWREQLVTSSTRCFFFYFIFFLSHGLIESRQNSLFRSRTPHGDCCLGIKTLGPRLQLPYSNHWRKKNAAAAPCVALKPINADRPDCSLGTEDPKYTCFAEKSVWHLVSSASCLQSSATQYPRMPSKRQIIFFLFVKCSLRWDEWLQFNLEPASLGLLAKRLKVLFQKKKKFW